MGPKALTGWNQCHCEDYQILIPMIFHGPKLELKQSRCHKNQDNASIDAPLTSKNHNFWSDRWIFMIQTFSETRSQGLSRNVKINLIHNLLKVATLKGLSMSLQGPSPRKACQGYKRPQAPLRPKKKETPLATAFCLDEFWAFLPSSKPKKHTKNTSKPLDSSLHQKYKVLFLYPIFFSLVLHLGFKI